MGEDETRAELVAYLRRAHARGLFVAHPKFTEIYPALTAPGEAPGSAVFVTSDDVVAWVEIRAALATSREGPDSVQAVRPSHGVDPSFR